MTSGQLSEGRGRVISWGFCTIVYAQPYNRMQVGLYTLVYGGSRQGPWIMNRNSALLASINTSKKIHISWLLNTEHLFPEYWVSYLTDITNEVSDFLRKVSLLMCPNQKQWQLLLKIRITLRIAPKKEFLHTSAMDTNLLWKIAERCYSACYSAYSLLQFGILRLPEVAKIFFITSFYLWGNGFDTIFAYRRGFWNKFLNSTIL